MTRLMITSALFLTACANSPSVVPAELTRPVLVECATGDASRALGRCAIALRAGLNTANDKLTSIGDLVGAQ